MVMQADLVDEFKDSCHDFCEALTRDGVETFTRFTTLQAFTPETVIAEINDVTNEFYLVISGEVRLIQDDTESGEVEVGRMGKGTLVGEMSFFDKLPRTVRLRASSDGAKVLVIHRPMYRRLTLEHPFIAVNLLEFVILSLDQLFRSTTSDLTAMRKRAKL